MAIAAAVDAVEEDGTLAPKADFLDAERALGHLARAEGAEGTARLVADFEGVDHALGVAPVALGIVDGVEQAEFGQEGLEPFGLQALAEVEAGFGLDRGDVVDAAANGIDVEHGAAGENHGVVVAEESVEQGEGIGFVLRRTVGLLEVERADKIVAHAGLLIEP